MNTHEPHIPTSQQEPVKLPCGKCEGIIWCADCRWAESDSVGFYCHKFGGYDTGCHHGEPK